MQNLIKGLTITSRFFTDEMASIFRDRGAILILFLALIIYPVIYGIAYSKEVLRDVPIAIVDLDNTSSSRLLTRMVGATEQLNVAISASSLSEAEELFKQGVVNGVVLIPSNFEKQLMSGSQATVSVYSDAGYFLVYKQTLSGVLKSTATFSAGVEVKRLMAKGATIEQALDRRDPVSLKTNLLFNPAGGYNTFVIPGLMIVILQQTLLIGIGLLGGTQHEIGRRRFIFPGGIKPASVLPVFFGKAGAYFVLYMVNVIITQIWVYDWFSLPNKGEMLAVFALMIPFLLAITFIGLGVSTFFKKREHSILFMVFLSPLVLFLSGLSWPTEAIPVWLNKLALIFPSTTMVPAFLRVRTMGATLNQVAPEYWFLVIQAILYGLISIALFYKNARIAAKKRSN